MQRFLRFLFLLMALFAFAVPASADSLYGPGHGLGGAPDLGQCRTVGELQMNYRRHGGIRWAASRLNEAINYDTRFRAIVAQSCARYGISQQQWVADAARCIDNAVVGGRVQKSRYPNGRGMLVVSSSLGPSTNRRFVYGPGQEYLAEYWAFYIGRVYDVTVDFSIICFCGNEALLAAELSPPKVVIPPSQPHPPGETENTGTPILVTVQFTGPTAGGYEQHPQFAPVVQSPTLVPPVPATNITIKGSVATVGNVAGGSASATGGSANASASSAPLHGTITVGASTANAATSTSVSGAGAAVGGGGPIGIATNGSGASGGSATTAPVTIQFGP